MGKVKKTFIVVQEKSLKKLHKKALQQKSVVPSSEIWDVIKDFYAEALNQYKAVRAELEAIISAAPRDNKNKIDESTSERFELARAEMTKLIITMDLVLKNKQGYVNDVHLLNLKCVILKAKFHACAHAWGYMWSEMIAFYFCVERPFRADAMKYQHDIDFQQEVDWLFDAMELYAKVPGAISYDKRIEHAVFGCRFAEGCSDEILKMRFYFRLLLIDDNAGRQQLDFQKYFPHAAVYGIYTTLRKKYDYVLENKLPDMKAIADYIKSSLMMFIFENLSSPDSLRFKYCSIPINKFHETIKITTTDADFKMHLEMTQKQRLDYLDLAVKLLSDNNFLLDFPAVVNREDMKVELKRLQTFLQEQVIDVYQLFLAKQESVALRQVDDLIINTKLEVIEFKRLVNILARGVHLIDGHTVSSDLKACTQTELALKDEEDELIALRKAELERKKTSATSHDDELIKWDKQQHEYEEKRLRMLEKRKPKKVSVSGNKKLVMKKKADDLEVSATSTQETIEAVTSENLIESFMHKAGAFIRCRQFSQAITAYTVAKNLSIKENDTFMTLSAFDGLMFASGYELFKDLDYCNNILSASLHHATIYSPQEYKAALALLKQAFAKFEKIKQLHADYEKLLSSKEVVVDADIQEGIAFGNQAMKRLLNLAENKLTRTQGACVELNDVLKISYNDYKYSRGLKAWRAQGNKGEITEENKAEIRRLGNEIVRKISKAKVAAYKEAHRNEPFSREAVFSDFTLVRDLLNEMTPLLYKLQAVPEAIRAQGKQFIDTEKKLLLTNNVFVAVRNKGEAHRTLLVVGETVAKLLRKSMDENTVLPENAILAGNGTDVSVAKYHVQTQTFTKTAVCCNGNRQVIDICGTGVDDILNHRLKMIASEPAKQINENPACLLEAIQHMSEDNDTPEDKLELAMRAWLPGNNYAQQYPNVLAAAKLQFSALPAEKRVKQVELLIEYGLMEKLFNIPHQKPHRALWALEDKWLVNISLAKFHLLAKTGMKQGAQDDIALNKTSALIKRD